MAPGKGKSTAEGKEENNEKGGEVDDSTAEGGKKEPPKQGEEPEQPPIPEEAVHQQPADDGVEVTVQGEEEEQQQEEESDDDDDTIGRHLCGFDDGYYDGPLYVEGPTTSPSSPPPPLLEMKAELGEDTNTSPADGVLDSLASPVGVPPLPQDGDDDEGDETLRPWQRRGKKKMQKKQEARHEGPQVKSESIVSKKRTEQVSKKEEEGSKTDEEDQEDEQKVDSKQDQKDKRYSKDHGGSVGF